MSIKVTTWVWEEAAASGADLLILLAIADTANDEGVAWPSKASLLRKTRVGANTLDRRLKALRDAGLLLREERAGTSNLYRLPVPWVHVMAVPTSPNRAPSPKVGSPRLGDPHGGGVGTPTVGGRGTPTVGEGVPPTVGDRTVSEPSGNGQGTTKGPTDDVPAVLELPIATPAPGRHPAEGFDDFWAVYPRREAKAAARRAWNNAAKHATPAQIVAGAARYRDDPNRDPAYTAHPATWLNAGRWDDDPLPARDPRTRPVTTTTDDRPQPGSRLWAMAEAQPRPHRHEGGAA